MRPCSAFDRYRVTYPAGKIPQNYRGIPAPPIFMDQAASEVLFGNGNRSFVCQPKVRNYRNVVLRYYFLKGWMRAYPKQWRMDRIVSYVLDFICRI
jgi:hypothetical protein